MIYTLNKKNILTIFSFFSILSINFNTILGPIAIIIFLVSGFFMFFSCGYISSIRSVLKNFGICLIPIIAIISVLWADRMDLALRGGVQLLMTTVIAIVMATVVEFRTLMISFMCAMLIVMLGSLLSTREVTNGLTGQVNLIGIYASKNFLATHTAFSIFISLIVFFETTNSRTVRMLSVVLLSISIMVLLRAGSLGAFFYLSLSLIISYLLAISFKSNNKKVARWVGANFVFLFFSAFSVLFVFYFMSGSGSDFLYGLGKDPTLTGRTYIWEMAFVEFFESPMLGAGFQNVFYIGNDVAEDIWEYIRIPSGAGFNFHNMYLDIAVELGLVGGTVMIINIYFFVIRIFRFSSIPLNSPQMFSIMVMVYMLLQNFLEAGWLNQFTMAHILICMAWVYLRKGNNYE